VVEVVWGYTLKPTSARMGSKLAEINHEESFKTPKMEEDWTNEWIFRLIALSQVASTPTNIENAKVPDREKTMARSKSLTVYYGPQGCFELSQDLGRRANLAQRP
jgi:hypothetical protein